MKGIVKLFINKRKALGDKPKSKWLTNGLITVDGTTHNINTINTISKCIEVLASLIGRSKDIEEAKKILDVEDFSFANIDDMISDIKTRCSIIKYDTELNTINKLEKELKGLRSEGARTSDAIDDISALLL